MGSTLRAQDRPPPPPFAAHKGTLVLKSPQRPLVQRSRPKHGHRILRNPTNPKALSTERARMAESLFKPKTSCPLRRQRTVVESPCLEVQGTRRWLHNCSCSPRIRPLSGVSQVVIGLKNRALTQSYVPWTSNSSPVRPRSKMLTADSESCVDTGLVMGTYRVYFSCDGFSWGFGIVYIAESIDHPRQL